MDVAALFVALIALVVALVSLGLVLLIYKEFVRTTFDSRNMERPITKAATGAYTGEQRIAARAVNATEQPISTPFLNAPDLPPEALAPSIGRPPIPKGGFGTKVVTKRGQ
jgi:hypothetical protein